MADSTTKDYRNSSPNLISCQLPCCTEARSTSVRNSVSFSSVTNLSPSVTFSRSSRSTTVASSNDFPPVVSIRTNFNDSRPTLSRSSNFSDFPTGTLSRPTNFTEFPRPTHLAADHPRGFTNQTNVNNITEYPQVRPLHPNSYTQSVSNNFHYDNWKFNPGRFSPDPTRFPPQEFSRYPPYSIPQRAQFRPSIFAPYGFNSYPSMDLGHPTYITEPQVANPPPYEHGQLINTPSINANRICIPVSRLQSPTHITMSARFPSPPPAQLPTTAPFSTINYQNTTDPPPSKQLFTNTEIKSRSRKIKTKRAKDKKVSATVGPAKPPTARLSPAKPHIRSSAIRQLQPDDISHIPPIRFRPYTFVQQPLIQDAYDADRSRYDVMNTTGYDVNDKSRPADVIDIDKYDYIPTPQNVKNDEDLTRTRFISFENKDIPYAYSDQSTTDNQQQRPAYSFYNYQPNDTGAYMFPMHSLQTGEYIAPVQGGATSTQNMSSRAEESGYDIQESQNLRALNLSGPVDLSGKQAANSEKVHKVNLQHNNVAHSQSNHLLQNGQNSRMQDIIEVDETEEVSNINNPNSKDLVIIDLISDEELNKKRGKSLETSSQLLMYTNKDNIQFTTGENTEGRNSEVKLDNTTAAVFDPIIVKDEAETVPVQYIPVGSSRWAMELEPITPPDSPVRLFGQPVNNNQNTWNKDENNNMNSNLSFLNSSTYGRSTLPLNQDFNPDFSLKTELFPSNPTSTNGQYLNNESEFANDNFLTPSIPNLTNFGEGRLDSIFTFLMPICPQEKARHILALSDRHNLPFSFFQRPLASSRGQFEPSSSSPAFTVVQLPGPNKLPELQKEEVSTTSTVTTGKRPRNTTTIHYRRDVESMLQQWYDTRATIVCPSDVEDVALKTGLSEGQVKAWLTNQRRREKRKRKLLEDEVEAALRCVRRRMELDSDLI